MKKLKLLEGQKFEAYVEDKIDEDSLFFHEYEMAVNSLNAIWSVQDKEKENNVYTSERANNIIAFCGERGSGKSSVMLSFIKAVANSSSNDDKLRFSEEIRNNNWKSKMIIDPSMFDGVHNIIDIVLAHIYQEFQNAYDKDNQMIDEYERERMIKQLSKVYKSLSIIKNKEKMLDDEYDESGNIAKLQKLGESTKLKDNIKELVDLYLTNVSKENKSDRKCEKLLLAIDDFDLCNENVYEMAEQIRKYLVLSNIIIVMAVKMGQLEMGIEEKNRGDFKNVLNGKQNDIYLNQEMKDMAERYATKLIPKARRIYLSELKSNQIQLGSSTYQNDSIESASQSLEHELIDLIRKKTGIYFVPTENGYNNLLPENLRELVNFIYLLKEMEDPGDNIDIKRNNISTFKSYFIEGMMKKNFNRNTNEELFEVIESANNINYNMCAVLKQPLKKEEDMFLGSRIKLPPESLAVVIEILVNRLRYLTTKKETLLTDYVEIYYTILLNEKFIGKIDISDHLIGSFIWGNRINGIIPGVLSESGQLLLNRERFLTTTLECWNIIADFMKEELYSFEKKDATKIKISKIKKENRWSEMIIWMLLSVLSSNFANGHEGKIHINRAPLIFDNYNVIRNIFISLENYVVNLCDLRKSYEFVDLEFLGIEKEEIQDAFVLLEFENAELIKQASVIMKNVELSMQLLDYCARNSDYKKATESDEDRTYQLIKKFMNNISDFLENLGMKKIDWTKFWIPSKRAEDGTIKGCQIDICRLYARICTVEVNNAKKPRMVPSVDMRAFQLKQEFSLKVTTIAQENYYAKTKDLTKSIQSKNRNVGYVKELLENMANCIQIYTFKEKRMPEGLNAELLQKLYSEVVDLYMQNPAIPLSDSQYNDFKEIAKIKDVIG